MQNNIPPRVEEMERNQLLTEMQLCASQADGAVAQLRMWGQRYTAAAHEWRMRQLFSPAPPDDAEMGEKLARRGILIQTRGADDPEVLALSAELEAAAAARENARKFPETLTAERGWASAMGVLVPFAAATPVNPIRPGLFVVALGEEFWRLEDGSARGPFDGRVAAEHPESDSALPRRSLNIREFASHLATHPDIGIEAVSTFIALLEPREQVMILNAWLLARDPIINVPTPAFWIDASGNVDAAPEVLALDAVLRVRRRLRSVLKQHAPTSALVDKLADELARCAVVGELVLARLALAQSYVAALSSQKDTSPSPSARPDAPEQKSNASATLPKPAASSGELMDHDDIRITDE